VEAYVNGTLIGGVEILFRPEHVYYVSWSGGCGGKKPCFTVLQSAIDSAETLAVINVTQETYAENIVFNSPKFLTLQGGWDLTFTNPSSPTVIQGSLTISNGKVIVEYITIR
jgi:hypothetical protein